MEKKRTVMNSHLHRRLMSRRKRHEIKAYLITKYICSVSANAFDVIIPSDRERWPRFCTIFVAYFRYSVVVLTNPYKNKLIFVSKYSELICIIGDK